MSRRRSLPSARVFLWAILIVAALVRVAYLAEYVTEIPHYDQPMVDARIYDLWSKEIRQGDLLGRERGVFYRAPLYPYFVAPFQSTSGAGPNPGLIVFQALLGVGMIWLTARWARQVAGDWAAVAAASLLLLYSPLLSAESKILSTTLGLFLQVAVFVLASGTTPRSPTSRFLLLGAVLGAAALVRPLWVLWLVALPFVLFGRELRSRTSLHKSAVFLLGAAIVISPVTLRNWVVADDFVPISANGGMTFFQGNNVENKSGLLTIISRFQMFGSADRQEEVERSVASELSGRELSPSESSRFWFQEGMRFVTERPLDWLTLERNKVLRFVSSFEYGDNYSHDLEADRIFVLRLLFVPFGLLLALAVVGIPSMDWGRRPSRLVVLSALTGVFGCLAFFVSSRYRMEAVPALAVLAASGLVYLVQGRRDWRRLSLWLLLGGAIFAFASRPVGMPARSQASISHLQMGNAHEQAGELAEAEAAYGRAIELLPENAFAWRNLLQLRVQKEGPENALQKLESAPEAARENPELLNLRGRFLSALGRNEEALADLERATREQPLHRDAWFHLARVRQQLGLYEESIAAYEETLELEYRPAAAGSALSFLYLQVGRPDSAFEAATRVLAIRPDDTEARMNLFISQIFLGRLGEARAERARLQDTGPLVDYYSGLLALREGRTADAIAELTAAWEADPGNRRAAYYLELALRGSGRPERVWAGQRNTSRRVEEWLQMRSSQPWAGVPADPPLRALWNEMVREAEENPSGPAAFIVHYVREEETGYSRERP